MKVNASRKKGVIILLFIFGIIIYLLMLMGRINGHKGGIVYVAINYITSNFFVLVLCSTLLYSILYWLFKICGSVRVSAYRHPLQNIKNPDIRIEKIQALYESGTLNKGSLSNYESLMFSAYFEKEQYETALTHLVKLREMIKQEEAGPPKIEILKWNILNLSRYSIFQF